MTPYDIIRRSLRWLGVIASNESPAAADVEDALSSLNSLIQSLGTSPLTLFAESTDNIPWSANTQSVTVGPSGSFISTRPLSVLTTTYVLFNGVSYPLAPLTPWDYNALTLKTQIKGIPTSFYVDAGMPNTGIFLWPIPAQDMTLVLKSTKRLATLALYDTLLLPDGYDRLLSFCLGQDIAPEYEKQLTADQLRAAINAKRAIKRMNAQIPRMDMPDGVPGGFGTPSAAWLYPYNGP